MTPVAEVTPVKSNTLLRARTALIFSVSLVLLIPCFWNRQIQAGDLASHIYNAWLASYLQSHPTPGLHEVSQRTNVLFDLMLSVLVSRVGASWAERIAVSICVLVFFWGACTLLWTARGSIDWSLTPLIAMLAYGWVFHMGFFNFYLSLGLCLWALAGVLAGRTWRLVGAVLLLALASLAHSLPVFWALGITTYIWLWKRAGHRLRTLLFVGSCVSIVVLRLILMREFDTTWTSRQLLLSFGGIDQFWVFSDRYLVVNALVMPFLVVMAAAAYESVATQHPFWCLAALNALAVALVPTAIQLREYPVPLSFIAERMSLALAIVFLLAVVQVPPKRWTIAVFLVAGLIFFSFLHDDTSRLSRVESRVYSLVRTIPPGQRVISGLCAGSRSIALGHVLDRACIGQCFSYGNYEPASSAFRIRASAENPVVLSKPDDVWAVEGGTYRVKKGDLPLFRLALTGSSPDTVELQALHEGDIPRLTCQRLLGDLF